jgi:hypothetical protein
LFSLLDVVLLLPFHLLFRQSTDITTTQNWGEKGFVAWHFARIIGGKRNKIRTFCALKTHVFVCKEYLSTVHSPERGISELGTSRQAREEYLTSSSGVLHRC